MKIGILTFHSQLNYGGVLQVYALQTALEKMGYEVVVLDRWLTPTNSALYGPFSSFRSFIRWGILLMLGRKTIGELFRNLKTIHFIQKYLHISKFHFYQWSDLKDKKIGVDCIVVGSDQVWNCVFNNPQPYLLIDIPFQIPAISYAASFGMKKIPIEWIDIYKQGLKKFSAISVRENEGKKLIESLGFPAEHVVDPTLLIDSSDWSPLIRSVKTKQPILVCYFLSENLREAIPLLENFSRKNHTKVVLFIGSDSQLVIPGINLKNLLSQIIWRIRLFFSSVKIYVAADPSNFVTYFSCANQVVSDSFHALMFSLIFKKNVSIIKPRDTFRKNMFSRIEEIAECLNISLDKLLSNSLASSLAEHSQKEQESYSHNDNLNLLRNSSSSWLKNQIKNVLENKPK